MRFFLSLFILICLLFVGNLSLLATPAFADDMEAKQKLLSKLKVNLDRAKKEHEIEVDSAKADTICNDESTTITDCRKAIRPIQKELNTKLKNPGVTSKTPVTTHIVGQSFGDTTLEVSKDKMSGKGSK